MRYIKEVVSTVVFGVLLSNSANAENNVDVVTTISVGTINMRLDINEVYNNNANSGLFNNDTRKININTKTPGAEIGVTVLDSKLYYGFTMLLTGQSVARYNISTFDVSQTLATSTSSQEITSRTSYSLFSGYGLSDQVNLYGGVTFGIGSYGREVNIDEYGPFVGGRYTFRFGATSSLNFDLALLLSTTETTLRDTDYKDGQHTIAATNTSLSYSATWLRALDRGRSFFVRLKIIDLALKGSTSIDATNGDGIGTATISGNQVLAQLSLGMGF